MCTLLPLDGDYRDLSNCLINDDFINELNDCFDTTGRSSLTSV